jgi:hypothetical protein
MSKLLGTAKVFAVLILFFVIFDNASAQTADSIYRLPAGTRIKLRMDGDIGSKFSSVNDTFLARVALPVVIRGVTVLPVGTVIEGRVIAASPAGLGSRNGRIDVRMETLKFSEVVDRSIDGVPVKPFKAKRNGTLLPAVGGSIIGAAVGFAIGSVPGAAIGAGIGGGIGAGAGYSRKGSDVRLKEDDVFEIELKKEVVLPVLDY